MHPLLSLLTNPPYIEWPTSLVELGGLLLFVGLLGFSILRYREVDEARWTQSKQVLLTLLLLTAIAANLFFGLRLSAEAALPRPGMPEDPRGPAVLFLSAVPWALAAGLLGPLPAVLVAFTGGLLRALFETHSLFTPLEQSALALLFALAVRQRYRTWGFRFLRSPMGAAVYVMLLYMPLSFATAVIDTSGALVARVDYAITRFPMDIAAAWAELLIAGMVASLAALAWPRAWGRAGPLQPSPIETSIQLRFFYGTFPLVLLLLFTLMLGDWIVAGQAARSMLETRLSHNARMAAESIPFFLEAGQNLILQSAADPRLLTTGREALPAVLAQDLRSVPYFRQLYLLDRDGEPVAGYPENEFARLYPTPEERVGVQLALKGVSIQTYTIPPQNGETTALVTFLATVYDSAGQAQGVLLGRTDLASNPFTKPIIQSFEQMRIEEGTMNSGVLGMILDENGRILYHPTPTRLLTPYQGRIPSSPDFFDETGSEGTRNLVYYQPTVGRPWAVVLTVPAQRAQQLALQIAIPVLFMILVVALVAIIALRLGLRVVTASLHNLASEAGRLARGQLDHPLVVQGVDEVGQLGTAFEQMRRSLKGRLDELNRLLQVSQGVAGSLNFADSVQPILRAALFEGASAARVVLVSDPEHAAQPDLPTRFGLGENAERYAGLDDQVLALARTHGRLVLTKLHRGRALNLPEGMPHPGALLAVALQRENEVYGALWVGYDGPRRFSEEEVRFLTTLAGEAALAASNARLYSTAEIGRQRLEAILDSTPEPVIVTDHQDRILLVNPAAEQLPGLEGKPVIGEPLENAINHPELMALLRLRSEEQPSQEISFTNGKTYHVTVSFVEADNRPVGKVCILRDITHYKELDALKSDFVSTVSHDLRSPISLIRGYATMIQMVGPQNDQQKNYLTRILQAVENMNHLVNNLLDIGRIEAGIDLQREPVAVQEAAERVISAFQVQAEQKKIQLSLAVDTPPDCQLFADPALLQQAITNLVDNAIKYTPVGGQVQVRTAQRNNGVVFEVRDNGMGIAPLDQPRLFEKFFRGGHRDASRERGSGLGLAIVRSIAERHGGRAWAESTLGKGSSFYLEIPSTEPVAAQG